MGRSGKGNKLAVKKEFSRSAIKKIKQEGFQHSFDVKDLQVMDPEDGSEVLAALISVLSDEYAPVERRLAAEMPTGLGERREGMFKTRSKIIEAVADDPRFSDILQVTVDLDSTLFPLDRAMREMGVDLPTTETDVWSEDENPVGDAILKSVGRPELADGNDLTPEQEKEKVQILIKFFEELHGDEELMKRAGVFEYGPQMIEEMRRQGITVHVVTHRSPDALDETEAWLEAMGIEYDDIVCDHAHEVDKIKYCTDNGVPIILDDKPKTIIDAEAAGVEAISLAWPYSVKALEEAGGDQAKCWREMTSHTISHIERLILERAKDLGVDIGVENPSYYKSKAIKSFKSSLAGDYT